jgi:hypothetical protein
MNYLTESKLGNILKSVFFTSQVEGQFRINLEGTSFRKIDYRVVLSEEDALKFLKLPYFSAQHFEDQIEIKDSSVILLLEFDGHQHYENVKAHKDRGTGLGFCAWEEIDSTTFGLRIPYWLQLDRRLMHLWFGIFEAYNEDFPQGFISPKVKLPSYFGVSGESRFLKEMETIPSEISKEVYESLLKKEIKFGAPQVASLKLWGELLRKFDPERSRLLKKFLAVGCEPSKFYKRFPKTLYEAHERDHLTASIYQGYFIEPKSEEKFQESLLQYKRYHKIKNGRGSASPV